MAPGLFEQSGSHAKKDVSWAPLFIESLWPGLYTNRTPLHDPSGLYELKYMGGRPGSLIGGINTEVSIRNTMIRRYGLSSFSTAIYPTPPNSAFSFQYTDGTIQVIIDGGPTGTLAITSVATSIGATAVYSGTISGGAANAFAGLEFGIAGFTNTVNNGNFLCTASTATTLTLQNNQAVSETIAATASSSGAVYVDNQNSTKTLLFAKDPAAGQTTFVAVAGILYMGDGVDVKQYTPRNTNGTIWNWGIVAPNKQPNVVVVESGVAAIQWQANTVWSTLGLIYDVTSDTTQQLNSVIQNADPNSQNSTIFGETGSGGPVWNQTPGGSTSDNTITWTNRGPIGLWQAAHQYSNASTGGTATNPCIIYDPVTKSCFLQSNSSPGLRTSGANPPHFIAAPGAHTDDGQIVWIWIGPGGIPGQWLPSHAYPALGSVSNNDVISSVTEPVSLASGLPTDGTVVYWQTSGGGTSAATGSPTFQTVGLPTSDRDITWLSLGKGSWSANRTVSAWTASGTVFSAIIDSGGNAQVCTTGGQTGATQPGTGLNPPWGAVYGQTTVDGTAIWTCVGTMMTWAVNTIWFLPVSGFSPPSSSSPFGGASVIDSNSNVEFVINSGKGGGSTPTWNTLSGGTFATSSTTDGAATWYNLEPFATQSLSWTKGHVYSYSFKARALDDFYSVIDPATGALPVPPGLSNALPAPTGSETNDISTASPVFTISGPNAGAVNTISGLGSTDPQVDTIVIWRDADGGGPANMFELTEIPAPQPIGGIAQPWSFKDFLPDTPTNEFPGLDPLTPAPIDDSNDPPLAGSKPMAFNLDRIWVALGDQILFSGGPDVLTGNPNAAFAPADEFPFLATVIRAVKNSLGLVVYTNNSIEIILGGPATVTFYSVTLAPGIGLGNYNALDLYAGEQFFMDTTGQLRILSPTLSLTAAGQPITDQLIKFNPETAYVAFHEQPNDTAIYIGTGTSTYNGSTGWFRMNPRQTPGGPNGPEPVWSPFAAITNGCKMLKSIEVSPGIKKLLVGSTLDGQAISERNTSVYTDNSTSYEANFQIGSLFMAHRGELALMKFVEADFALPTTNPIVSYLLNETSGTFTNFSQQQFDPPTVYGATLSPTTYNPLRFYFSAQQQLARCIHAQFGVDFGVGPNADEVFNFTVYGAIAKGM